MAQAALPFDTPVAAHRPTVALRLHAPDAGTPVDPVAWAIGRDHARHRLTPPMAHLQAESPVHQGWRNGRAVFGGRTLPATPWVRRWLQLRLAAWMDGRVFEDVQVTPQFLRQIAVDTCPVTREPITDDGARVVRLCDRAGVAAGNLATLSARAAGAKATLGWDEALAVADRLAADGAGSADTLAAAEWSRLGVLMSFATPLPHHVAATVPLRLLPPNRVRVLNPVQAVQVMLTLQFLHAGYARRLVTLAALMPTSELRQAFQVFMHTLLARRLSAGQAADRTVLRQALEDSWADPLVHRRWQRLALRLTSADCERLLQRAASRDLATPGATWLSLDHATDGWALATSGRVQVPATVCHDAGGADRPMPGSDRKRGSQKLANCAVVTALGAFQ
ncbi:hypothetical protein [Ideonella sp. A 288]|uniref:hypothetical protein n=1 Tax=Ideonella sp. A 288 TaxID=1962181 RepID=UPI000B4B8A58|nr:hypothetical protein [Ideonella sp. A 288]